MPQERESRSSVKELVLGWRKWIRLGKSMLVEFGEFGEEKEEE